jgi:hypothetical protein
LDLKELTAMFRLKTAITVDQARTAIRNLLRTLPTPAPTPPPPTPGPTPQPNPEPPPIAFDLPPAPPIVFPKKASSTWLWWIIGGTSAVAITTIAVVLLKGKKSPSSAVAGTRASSKGSKGSKSSKPVDDVIVEHHGSIVQILPRSGAGRTWIRDNVYAEDWQWSGSKRSPRLSIDTRFASDIIEGLKRDGLTVKY